MSNYSTSSKAGNEASHQPASSHQNKEADNATSQGNTIRAGKNIGFDFGEIPMYTPSRHNPNLPGELQANLETSFRQDFSDVNIHTSSQAAQHLNALAYTQGEGIHFAPGEFNPHSESGRNLIGHEFTHIVQQRSGVVQPNAVLGKGLPLNDNQGLENEANSLGRKAVQGEVVEKYRSPSLGIRSGLRTVLAKRDVIQRDIKGNQELKNGKMEVDFTKNDAAAAGDRATETGTVKFTPNGKAPNANKIRLIQIVRTTDTTGKTEKDYTWTGGEGDRNKVMTTRDTKKNIAGGFFIDHSAADPKANPRTKKSDATISPYYRDYWPNSSDSQDGYKKSKADIQPASLWDGPGDSAPGRFLFVTSAKASDTGYWYGSVLWGFEIYLDKGKAKIKSEYKSFRENPGETTLAALDKFNEFYKNPDTPDAPTK
ncbi:MAG TPA: DUF4157 domain-containing protein [Lunatimonas sp.]|nr:DUF4157 domain-containing protein [Lunatimonas sp.]